MQHGKITTQEAQTVIQYAESYVILPWQMMNVSLTFLNVFFLFFHVSNISNVFNFFLQRFYVYAMSIS